MGYSIYVNRVSKSGQYTEVSILVLLTNYDKGLYELTQSGFLHLVRLCPDCYNVTNIFVRDTCDYIYDCQQLSG